MGIAPILTSAMSMQCSTNWAIKPTGSWSLTIILRVRNNIYMNTVPVKDELMIYMFECTLWDTHLNLSPAVQMYVSYIHIHHFLKESRKLGISRGSRPKKRYLWEGWESKSTNSKQEVSGLKIVSSFIQHIVLNYWYMYTSCNMKRSHQRQVHVVPELLSFHFILPLDQLFSSKFAHRLSWTLHRLIGSRDFGMSCSLHWGFSTSIHSHLLCRPAIHELLSAILTTEKKHYLFYTHKNYN